MRTTWVAALLFVATSLSAAVQDSPFPKATPASQGVADKDLETLANVVRGFVQRQQVVGAELLIIENDHVVYHQGFGHKEKDKNQELPPNTIFCVRSMTKPVIGAAVQILIDEGKVGLEDPVAKYLPAFDNDKSRTITIRQLLTHKGGGLKLSTLLSVGLKGVPGVAELADVIGKNGPDLKPGEKFNYSDDGTDTLTALVAKVTQMPAERFVQERLLDPMGMKDTICVLKTDDPRMERVTAAYGGATGSWRKFWTPGEPPIFSYFLGSQGMYSTPADYARFLKLIADGGKWHGKQILSKEAIERILTPTDASSLTTTFDDWTCAYGQMMMLYRDATGKVRAFGHGGSDGTHAYAIPEKGLYALYFTQSRGNLTSLDFEPALHRLLIEPGKKAFVADKAVDPKTVAPFLGLYWFDAVKCPVAVEVREGKLQLEVPFQAEVELKPTDNPNE